MSGRLRIEGDWPSWQLAQVASGASCGGTCIALRIRVMIACLAWLDCCPTASGIDFSCMTLVVVFGVGPASRVPQYSHPGACQGRCGILGRGMPPSRSHRKTRIFRRSCSAVTGRRGYMSHLVVARSRSLGVIQRDTSRRFHY